MIFSFRSVVVLSNHLLQFYQLTGDVYHTKGVHLPGHQKASRKGTEFSFTLSEEATL